VTAGSQQLGLPLPRAGRRLAALIVGAESGTNREVGFYATVLSDIYFSVWSNGNNIIMESRVNIGPV